MSEQMDFEDGKYTAIYDNGRLKALRYGQPWRDLTGDNLVYAMLVKASQLKKERDTLAAKLKEQDARIDDLLATCHRLALELECLLLDTKDAAPVSRWWDSAMAALDGWHKAKDAAATRPVPAEKVIEAAIADTDSPWKNAVIEQLVVAHILTAEHESDPRKAIQDLLAYNSEIAVDPRVSDAAALLAEQTRAEEREACAKVCDSLVHPSFMTNDPGRMWILGTTDCAAAIRKQGYKVES